GGTDPTWSAGEPPGLHPGPPLLGYRAALLAPFAGPGRADLSNASVASARRCSRGTQQDFLFLRFCSVAAFGAVCLHAPARLPGGPVSDGRPLFRQAAPKSDSAAQRVA